MGMFGPGDKIMLTMKQAASFRDKLVLTHEEEIGLEEDSIASGARPANSKAISAAQKLTPPPFVGALPDDHEPGGGDQGSDPLSHTESGEGTAPAILGDLPSRPSGPPQ